MPADSLPTPPLVRFYARYCGMHDGLPPSLRECEEATGISRSLVKSMRGKKCRKP